MDATDGGSLPSQLSLIHNLHCTSVSAGLLLDCKAHPFAVINVATLHRPSLLIEGWLVIWQGHSYFHLVLN